MHPASSADWTLVDGTLRGLALSQTQLDSEIGRWLIAAQRTKPWLKCGMRSIHEYVERIFHWSPQSISERLRTATALLELPRLDVALATGLLSFSIVKELTRVATPETEEEWLGFATGKTARDVEAKVARHVKGERPTDRGDVSRVKVRMVLTLSVDQAAIIRSAIAAMRKHDPTLTEEECIAMWAAASGGSKEAPTETQPPRPDRLQVEIGLDGSSFLKGIGEERHEISPALAECVQCDAEIWLRRPDGTVVKLRTTIPQPMRRLAFERAKGRCELCKLRLKPQLHHLWLVSEGGKHDIENLLVLCKAHHDRVHEGSLWIRGTRSTGFTFTMADGAPYGSGAPSPKAAVNIEVFQGLRGLGFKEAEIRPVLEALHPRELPVEKLLGEALRMLHKKRSSPTWENSAVAPAAVAAGVVAPAAVVVTPAASATELFADARDGLFGMGFTEAEVAPVLSALRGEELPLPELLRQSLRMLHQRRSGAVSSPTWETGTAAKNPAVPPEKPQDRAAPSSPDAAVSPTWERPPARKYRIRSDETEGVAESAAHYGLGEAPIEPRRARRRPSHRSRYIVSLW